MMLSLILRLASILGTLYWIKALEHKEGRSANTAYFKVHEDSILLLDANESKAMLVHNINECGHACVKNYFCLSFNIAIRSNKLGHLRCELLANDKYNEPSKFVTSKDFHHYSMLTPCLMNPCKNSRKCIPYYQHDTYTCQTGKWLQLSPDPVCFEGKDKKPGEFSPLFKTSSKKLKLVHQSGLIRCADNEVHNSYWGCWDHPKLKGNGLNVVITDESNKIILPTKFDFPEGKWYKIPGYNSKSKFLVFTSNSSLSFGGRLKLWYGEDLDDYTTTDNHGKVCAEIFVYGG